MHAPVLHALAGNEATPESIRRDLEMGVSLFDLLREMERAPDNEKEERAEAVKTIYQQLPRDLKPIVKQLAKQLARPVNATGTTLEMPPLPTEAPDWEALMRPPASTRAAEDRAYRAPKQERTFTAEATVVQDDLQRYLWDDEAEVRTAALKNPALAEDFLVINLSGCTNPSLFEEIYLEARWYFKDAIREALWGAPCCPEAMAKKLSGTRDLVRLLEQNARKTRQLGRIVSLFTQMEESEYQYLTFWAKRKAPSMLRVIKIFFDRLQRRRTHQASGLSPVQSEGRWVSLEERVFMANQATQPDQILVALRDPDPKVFRVALENPGLTPRELIAIVPQLDALRAEQLASSRTWAAFPAVREALLHNVHLGEETAVSLLRGLQGPPRLLLDLLRDQRIPHLAVKQLALDLLRQAYEEMDSAHRILALRASGGELIRHLPGEILRDEATLRLLVADRQLDPALLLRLARNKLTPRPILELIALHPVLMAHAAVMTELLLNPKTPREASNRIWGLLSASEQQSLLRSPHLPTSLRALA